MFQKIIKETDKELQDGYIKHLNGLLNHRKLPKSSSDTSTTKWTMDKATKYTAKHARSIAKQKLETKLNAVHKELKKMKTDAHQSAQNQS